MTESQPSRASATVLGRSFGLSGMEMNLLLRAQGMLEGEPGSYGVTDAGARFAHEKFVQRGTGGYSHYNPSWDERSWDFSILEQLDLDDDELQKAKDAASAVRLARGAVRASDDDVDFDDCEATDGSDPDWGTIVAFFVAAIGVGLVLKYGVPRAKKWWAERAEQRRESE